MWKQPQTTTKVIKKTVVLILLVRSCEIAFLLKGRLGKRTMK